MTTENTTYECPRCNSVISIKQRAGQADFFTCPACLEGEIASRTGQTDADRIAGTLLSGAREWIILVPSLETMATG